VAILVSDLQATLAGRCGATLTKAGLDGSASSSAWLDPLAESAREMGVTLASPLTVADADLAAVTQAQVSQLVDVAELRSLENALGNLTKVSQKVSLGAQDWGELRDGLERAIGRLAARARDLYGVGRGTVQGGTVRLDFQEPTPPWGWDCEPGCP
jgi:hypothetical protein